MADAGINHLLLFIASITITAAVIGSMFAIVQDYKSFMVNKSNTEVNNMYLDFEIINIDDGGVPNNPVIFYVKNTAIKNVYVDPTAMTTQIVGGSFSKTYVGTANGTVSYYVLKADGSNNTAWESGDVLKITINLNLSDGDYRVKITSEEGISDTLKFVIS